MSEQRRIAMWSGPRNISTAMMRAWGNRQDTVVIDEPFYAFYLHRTGAAHPSAKEVIDHGERDWRKVVAQLTGPIPNGARNYYQKQMTHHLLPEVGREWLHEVTNCFLIRDPAEVIVSYIKKNPDPELHDLGFVQQLEIFNHVREHEGTIPTVIDARDVLEDPERSLRSLCRVLGVEFDGAMLSWPPGLRDTDGIWAKHWYGEVAHSTGFQRYREKEYAVPQRLRELYERCREIYEELYAHRVIPSEADA